MTKTNTNGLKVGFQGVLRNERTHAANAPVLLVDRDGLFAGRFVRATGVGSVVLAYRLTSGGNVYAFCREESIIRRLA